MFVNSRRREKLQDLIDTLIPKGVTFAHPTYILASRMMVIDVGDQKVIQRYLNKAYKLAVDMGIEQEYIDSFNDIIVPEIEMGNMPAVQYYKGEGGGGGWFSGWINTEFHDATHTCEKCNQHFRKEK